MPTFPPPGMVAARKTCIYSSFHSIQPIMKNLIIGLSFVGALLVGISVQAQLAPSGPVIGSQQGVLVQNNSDCAYEVTLFSAHPLTAGAYCIFGIASTTKLVKPGGTVNFPPVPVPYMNFNLTLIPGFVRVVDVKNPNNRVDSYLTGCNSGFFSPSNTMPSCIPGETVSVNPTVGTFGVTIE